MTGDGCGPVADEAKRMYDRMPFAKFEREVARRAAAGRDCWSEVYVRYVEGDT